MPYRFCQRKFLIFPTMCDNRWHYNCLFILEVYKTDIALTAFLIFFKLVHNRWWWWLGWWMVMLVMVVVVVGTGWWWWQWMGDASVFWMSKRTTFLETSWKLFNSFPQYFRFRIKSFEDIFWKVFQFRKIGFFFRIQKFSNFSTRKNRLCRVVWSIFWLVFSFEKVDNMHKIYTLFHIFKKRKISYFHLCKLFPA